MDAELLEILQDTGLPAVLAEGIFTDPSETLRDESILVETRLLVAVGMDARRLGEDISSDDRLVGRNPYSGDGLHIVADTGQRGFVQRIRNAKLVVEDGKGAGDRNIPGPLSQPVDCRVDAADSGAHRLEDIGCREVIVIVGVEVEAAAWIFLHHPCAELASLGRIEDAEGVREHEPFYSGILETVHHEEDIVRRRNHSVGPVLKVEIDSHPLCLSLGDTVPDFRHMLLRSLSELPFKMPQGTFGKEIHHFAAGRGDPVDGQASVDKAQGLDPVDVTSGSGPGAKS